jgi:Mg2+ and Co2+ transporter CorA
MCEYKGVSWDVLSALALVFDLHPLAVEDVLEQGQVRSKADWFPNHLFVHILDHTVHSPEEHSLRRNRRDPQSRAEDSDGSTSSSSSDSDGGYEIIASAENITEEDVRRSRLYTLNRFRKGSHQSRTKERRDVEQGVTTSQRVNGWWYEKTSLLSRVSRNPFLISIHPHIHCLQNGRRRASKLAQLEALKHKNRVRVHVTNAFFFLFHDGTLISIHQMPFGDQIVNRLKRPGSLLRAEPDASLLLQSCLDFGASPRQ